MKKNWITQAILSKHIRLTKPRKTVLEYLEGNCKIFSAYQLLTAMPTLDKVSVYRTLDLLEAADIIHSVTSIDGHKYYELHSPEGHHHHAICTDCKQSECVDCPLPNENKRHHVLSYSHTCAACS